jgi:phage terminase small subunit
MANHPHNSKRPTSRAVAAAIATGDINDVLRVLSARQRRFAEEYVFDFNAAAAAIRAGYSIKNAEKQAYTLCRHAGIAFYIDHLTKTKETNITVIDENWIVQKIITTIEKAETITNLTAALRGLELLARHKGMLTDKQEITGKDGGPIEVERRAQEDADSLVEQLKSLSKKVSDKKDVVILDI